MEGVYKMDITIKSQDIGKFCITMELNSFGVYEVQVLPKFDEYRCGYPIRHTYYKDIKKANNTYNRYLREFK